MNAVFALLLLLRGAEAGGDVTLQRVDVQADAEAAPARDSSVSTLPGDTIESVAPTHPQELFARVPGTWISRGSGQELLSAIRSPVLTGTGACGEMLWSEDGVPLRPAGLCNVNGLYEVDFEQAAAVEVLRGPGTALHGSNALHGVINVVGADAHADVQRARLEAGSYDYLRATASLGRGDATGGWRADALGVASGSFRDGESVGLEKLRLRYDRSDGAHADSVTFAAANLNQETAGYVTGYGAYRDDVVRRSNANPDAFRDGAAQRLAWRRDGSLDATAYSVLAYARNDTLRFLQHFNPGKPLEDDADRSVGTRLLFDRRERDVETAFGADVEFAHGDTRETQAQPLTTGSAAQNATRPAGRHYDYGVDALSFALFGQLRWHLAPHTLLVAGLRAERLTYRYDNRMRDGNSREDGSACALGGCLFLRPADRSDGFAHAAPKLGLVQTLGPRWEAYARLADGFRFPQAAELYRLQRGQASADLATETLRSAEAGVRGAGDGWSGEIAMYTMRKKHWLFRDANGFNVDNGRTRHAGVEASGDVALGGGFSLAGNASYADQRYAFDALLPGGERVVDGNVVDTAPRWLADARLRWSLDHDTLELEAQHIGAYWLDAANTARYPGHVLWTLRWTRALAPEWDVGVRVANLFDRAYAERADYAFGEYRYFPGAPRSVFVSVGWHP